ncbi:MAG: FAD-dependent oxidoreductase [Oscillospiraceae bacterium]|nr:FAD-dependent oxidoreductase [Oscillospiraceae bacterium]
MDYVNEPQKQIPIIFETDVLVLGGSSTGVFAAVRAARRGVNVTLVEKNNMLGGTSTAAFVCHWPAGLDSHFENQIIGGLSFEFIDRLKKRGFVSQLSSDTHPYSFLPSEMSVELDKYILENNIKLYLHTLVCDPYINDNNLCGVFVENKDGRGLIKAKVIIDCTGDGDLLYKLGVPSYCSDNLQPPTMCMLVSGLDELKKNKINWRGSIETLGSKYGLEPDWGWSFKLPGRFDVRILAENHILGGNLCNADDLTRAEIEGRKKARAIMDLIKDISPEEIQPCMHVLPASIGIRQTRQFKALHTARQDDLMNGVIPDDVIGLCANRVDIHNGKDGSISFKYLTGDIVEIKSMNSPAVKSRWLPEGVESKRYYGIGYSSCIPDSKYPNLLMAGRMLDADEGAFGALRLQMYLNEIGEAAGEAAAIMVKTNAAAKDVDIKQLQNNLVNGGTILPSSL